MLDTTPISLRCSVCGSSITLMMESIKDELPIETQEQVNHIMADKHQCAAVDYPGVE